MDIELKVSTESFDKSCDTLGENAMNEMKNNYIHTEQHHGHHMKAVMESYSHLLIKRYSCKKDSLSLWRFYKIYCESANKIALRFLCYYTNKSDAVRRLLDALDHALLGWAKEINNNKASSQRQIELYFQQLLMTAINKAWFHRRNQHWDISFGVLQGIQPVCDELERSSYSNTHHIRALFWFAYGAIYTELAAYKESVASFISGMKCLSKEQSLLYRGNYYLEGSRFKPKVAYRIRTNIHYIIMGMYNIGKCFIELRKENLAMDSFRLCSWFNERDRQIFQNLPPTKLKYFLQEEIFEKQIWVQELIQAAMENQKKKQVKKCKTVLSLSDINYKISKMWSRLPNYRKLQKLGTKNDNFTSILSTVDSNPKRATLSFNKKKKKIKSGVKSSPANKAKQNLSVKLKNQAHNIQEEKERRKMISPDEYLFMIKLKRFNFL